MTKKEFKKYYNKISNKPYYSTLMLPSGKILINTPGGVFVWFEYRKIQAINSNKEWYGHVFKILNPFDIPKNWKLEVFINRSNVKLYELYEKFV